MERKLIEYLPYVVRDYAEFQGIAEAEQLEFENAWAAVDDLLANQFVRTAGNLGLSRWEKLLGIVPKGTDTFDGRRFRILTRLNERLPYTLPRFRQMLESLCGAGNSSAEIAAGTYRLRIWVAEDVWGYLPELRSLTARIVPVNLLCFYEIRMNPIELFHPNNFRLVRLKIRGGVNNWFQSPVLFNGAVDFDGSIRWNQQIVARNSLELRIRSSVETGSGAAASLRFPWHFQQSQGAVSSLSVRSRFLSGAFLRLVPLGVRSRASFQNPERGIIVPAVSSKFCEQNAANQKSISVYDFHNKNGAESGRIRLHSGQENGWGSAARIITNRSFLFDGQKSFDGKKKFNSGVAAEL